MRKVLLTVTKGECRSRYHKTGDRFIVGDICPPICHELWNAIYPYLFAIQNGAALDHGEERVPAFDVQCPDGGRVCIHGELLQK